MVPSTRDIFDVINMQRYLELYSELQDFRRQQPFGFTRFFGNVPSNVYSRDGTIIQQAPFLVLHERVRELLASLTEIQIQKYTADLSRTMNTFIRWLAHGRRLRGWRGQAPGKENENPQGSGVRLASLDISGVSHRRRSYR